jgi:hypothetical protein
MSILGPSLPAELAKPKYLVCGVCSDARRLSEGKARGRNNIVVVCGCIGEVEAAAGSGSTSQHDMTPTQGHCGSRQRWVSPLSYEMFSVAIRKQAPASVIRFQGFRQPSDDIR